MDDQTKAKGLMAAGLVILVAAALIVVMVVVPALTGGEASSTAVAQAPPPGAGGGGGAPGAAPGAMPASPPGGGGMPGMGAGMPGMGGGGAPGGAGPGAGPPGAGAPAAADAVEPIEEYRENPFAPAAGAGLVSSGLPSSIAFQPSRHTMPVTSFDQHDYPAKGPSGETIQVPGAAPSARASGPETPTQEEWMRVSGVLQDPQGRAMVILVGGQGQKGTVLQVGDRWQGWQVESITKAQMSLSRGEGAAKERRIIHLQTGGAGRRGNRGGANTQPRGTQPGAQPGARRPGAAFPGVGGGGNQRRTRPPAQ